MTMVVRDVISVEVIVIMVADVRGLTGSDKRGWVIGVTEKLVDIGLRTVDDFVREVLFVQGRLVDGGHRRLHDCTMRALMKEACDILLGPEGMEE